MAHGSIQCVAVPTKLPATKSFVLEIIRRRWSVPERHSLLPHPLPSAFPPSAEALVPLPPCPGSVGLRTTTRNEGGSQLCRPWLGLGPTGLGCSSGLCSSHLTCCFRFDLVRSSCSHGKQEDLTRLGRQVEELEFDWLRNIFRRYAF